MSRWPHDDPASLAAYYGSPDNDEPRRQLVPVVPPFTMYYAGKAVRQIMLHRKAAGALTAALNEIWEKCQRSQAKIGERSVTGGQLYLARRTADRCGWRVRSDHRSRRADAVDLAWGTGWVWAYLIGQRGSARPARGYCGQHDWPVAAGKPVAVEAFGQAPWPGWLLGTGDR